MPPLPAGGRGPPRGFGLKGPCRTTSTAKGTPGGGTPTPNNPLGGYTGVFGSTSFLRAIDNASFAGGVSVTTAGFRFNGSMQTDFYGQSDLGAGTPIATNPVLAQPVFGAGPTPAGQANRG